MAYNVVELRAVAAKDVDSYNRVAKFATTDLPNGSIVTLGTKNTDGTWVVTAPAADTTLGVYMVASPAVVHTSKTSGGSADPRDFTNKKTEPLDTFKPQIGDIIGMTGEGIAGIATASNTHLNVAAGSTTLEVGTSAGTGFSMKKVGTDVLKVGDGSLVPSVVTTYVFEVVNN